jgi:hypothetical protein
MPYVIPIRHGDPWIAHIHIYIHLHMGIYVHEPQPYLGTWGDSRFRDVKTKTKDTVYMLCSFLSCIDSFPKGSETPPDQIPAL